MTIKKQATERYSNPLKDLFLKRLKKKIKPIKLRISIQYLINKTRGIS